jgi:3-dehydroquinate dehydratase
VTQTAKLCLPIIGKNFQEILDSIQTSQPLVENLEIRFDYLENPQVDFVEQILPSVDPSKKVIFTFRPKKEGGELFKKLLPPVLILWILILQILA